MVLHHGDHGMLHVLLLGCQVGCRVLLLELGSQLLDDGVGVGDLLAIQLNEGQQPPLGSELGVVVNVLNMGQNENKCVK